MFATLINIQFKQYGVALAARLRGRRTKLVAGISALIITTAVVLVLGTANTTRSAQAVPSTKPASALTVPANGARHYKPLPSSGDSWYWEIDPPAAGVTGLPSVSATYPAPGSATIWDTDLFEDSNTSSGSTLAIPTGGSPVVEAIHAAGHYSICYVEAGAYQDDFPDAADYAPSDYGARAERYRMQGYPNEWWLDITGFKGYVAGEDSTLSGAAINIAAALNDRFKWCAVEGQDAVEADDLDGYTNRSAAGDPGGGWSLTRAESTGFERWIAYQTHADGLAVLQKNDPADAATDEPLFDGVVSEECNFFGDPCAGTDGDWDAYLAAGKPVLDAEYSQDGETTAKFCPADRSWRIWGALYSVDLNGDKTYGVCWSADNHP